MKIQLDRDEFWPYITQARHTVGAPFEIPNNLWKTYEAARMAFEKEHENLMTCIESQGRTAKF